jgi:hypothetical protein
VPDFDYTELVQAAQELISDFGRDITLVELDDLIDNPQKPWRATAAPRLTPKRGVIVRATQLEVSSLERFGVEAVAEDLLRRTTIVFMVAQLTDPRTFHEVQDSGTRYGILFTRTLQPGPTQLLNFFGCSR